MGKSLGNNYSIKKGMRSTKYSTKQMETALSVAKCMMDASCVLHKLTDREGEYQRRKKKLIELFKFGTQPGKPALLSYEYRKKHSGFKTDRPVLIRMTIEKSIVVLEKTNKTVLYKYIGE